MRRSLLALALLLFCVPIFSQYYLRGEVRDQQGIALRDVKIQLRSKGAFPYYSGSSGAFGIPTSSKVDTITLTFEGYETIKTAVQTTQFASFTLKLSSVKTNQARFKLSSLTKNLITYQPYAQTETGESYSTTVENDFVNSNQYPETGFSLNVDRASYSNVRRFLNLGTKPPKDAVRIEELLNYFNFKAKEPTDSSQVFSVQTKLTSCPWKVSDQLLFINLQAKKINLDKTPPSNLVFLIDVSGSMDEANKLPLIKSSFKLLAENLRSIDTVSIITYGGQVSVQLIPTGGDQKQKIIEAIEGLTAAGSTPGESAIRTAYRYALSTFIKGGNNRVILATDGDFNVGQKSEKELEDLITQQRQTGIYLTCLGVGMGNYKDSKLEALAKRGNGNFAYLDNEKEAEKVLVQEFAQTVYSVANDVYLNVHFNASMVKEYRLIGFDNPQNAVADTMVTLEGGEVGSGHALLAVFEIVPADKNISTANKSVENIASLKLTYKLPEAKDKQLNRIFQVPQNFTNLPQAEPCYQFAASVIMFGGMLKESKFFKDLAWEDASKLADASSQSSNLLQTEFLGLIEKAKRIYPRRKKK